MTDHRLGRAFSEEADTQHIIAAFQKRCAQIVEERGTIRDPNFSDEITDESIKYVQENGFPKVNVFSLHDIAEAQKGANEHSPIMNFVEADNIIYKTLLGNNTGVVESRFDDSVAHSERLEYMGSYAQNHSVIAVIDGTGRKFIAEGTQQNRDFLEQHGYKDSGRNFNVPFSNAEIAIGLKDKGFSYGVHKMVMELIGKSVMEPDAFNRAIQSEKPAAGFKHGQPTGL